MSQYQSRTRRQFLEESMLAGVAAVTAGSAVSTVAAAERNASANDRLSVAVIGVRGRGRAHLGAYWAHKDTEVTYICDVDEQAGQQRVTEAESRQGRKPIFVRDMRRIFDDESVDIVSIATPNHWHALASIWAMQSGKDVYVEKPVSHNVSEGRRMVQVARRHKRICQTGCQIRSMKGMRDAVAFVHAGHLGEITVGRALAYGARSPIGKRGTYQPPAQIDYNLWQGPAAEAQLTRPRLHYDWHWQWPYGNGDLGNVGIHRVDLARWAMKLDTHCQSVISYGGRFSWDDAGDTPNTHVTICNYGDKALVSEVRNLKSPALKGAGIMILEGTDGYLLMNAYSNGVAFDKNGKQIQKFSGGKEDHFDNFIQAVKSRRREDLRAEIEEGHLSSAACHLGNISYQLGRPVSISEAKVRLAAVKTSEAVLETFQRTTAHLSQHGIDLDKEQLTLGPLLTFQPASETFTENSPANALLTREYRKPFVVPVEGAL